MNEQEAVVYSAYVGIDWANSKHDVCVRRASSVFVNKVVASIDHAALDSCSFSA